jgi:hypothetical protein
MHRAGAGGAPPRAAHVVELVEPGVGYHVGEPELAPAHGREGSLRCTSGQKEGPNRGPRRLQGEHGYVASERGRVCVMRGVGRQVVPFLSVVLSLSTT